jgi:lysophospholipase L1-like esterase
MSILLDIRQSDRFLWLGDSKTQGDNYGIPSDGIQVPKWHVFLAQQITAVFMAKGLPPPVHITSGVAGDTVGAIVSGIDDRCYQWNPDVVVLEVTTNDVTDAIANATYQANLISLITGIQDPGNYPTGRAPRWILMIGPNFIGEKWPNGANAFDTVPTGIDAKAAIYTAQAAALGFVAWNPRTAALAWETANNPSEFPSGLMTSALDGTTGKHEITLGCNAMASWLLNNTFAGIPAGLPQFPLFAFVTS